MSKKCCSCLFFFFSSSTIIIIYIPSLLYTHFSVSSSSSAEAQVKNDFNRELTIQHNVPAPYYRYVLLLRRRQTTRRNTKFSFFLFSAPSSVFFYTCTVRPRITGININTDSFFFFLLVLLLLRRPPILRFKETFIITKRRVNNYLTPLDRFSFSKQKEYNSTTPPFVKIEWQQKSFATVQ